MSDDLISGKDLFMMCKALNEKALAPLPEGYHVRTCKREELDVWKAMPFDNPQEAKEHQGFMTDFFNQVYGGDIDLFFSTCLFICDQHDDPVGTAFIWKVYGEFNTVHWLKVLKQHEGRGLGRAILSTIMKDLGSTAYPIYLHTHPASYRAIKLYSDFGFKVLTDPLIGSRKNDLRECLPYLERMMPELDFKKLQFSSAPPEFLAKLGEVEREPHF